MIKRVNTIMKGIKKILRTKYFNLEKLDARDACPRLWALEIPHCIGVFMLIETRKQRLKTISLENLRFTCCTVKLLWLLSIIARGLEPREKIW